MTRHGYTMTEDEWLSCDDHMRITYFVAEQMSVRKLRLAEVALCRRLEQYFKDTHCWHTLRVCEAHADGAASDAELEHVRGIAHTAYRALLPHSNERHDEFMAVLSLSLATDTEPRLRMNIDMLDIALFAPDPPPDSIPPAVRVEAVAKAAIVRDVFGNPFRPVIFDARWCNETVVSLASAIYAERAFDRMPILADALEEAGCDHLALQRG